MEEETSKQMFEKVRELMASERENTNEILKYEQEAAQDVNMDISKEMDQLVTNPQLFVDIENDMRDVEKNFSNDPALEAFKVRFETLFVAMNSSKENEAVLMRKCSQLKGEAGVVRAKITSSISLTKEQIKDAEDKVIEIEKSWKKAETSQKNMKELEDRIETVKERAKEVEHKIQEATQNAETQKLQKINEKKHEKEEKDKILRMRESELRDAKSHNDKLIVENSNLESENFKLLQKTNELKKKYHDVVDDIEDKSKKVQEIEQSKEELEKSIADANKALQERVAELEQVRSERQKESQKWSEESKRKEEVKKKLAAENIKIKAYSEEIKKIRENNATTQEQIERDEENLRFEKRNKDAFERDFAKLLAERAAMNRLKNDLQLQSQHLTQDLELLKTEIQEEEKVIAERKKLFNEKSSEKEVEVKERGNMEHAIKEAKTKIQNTNDFSLKEESNLKKLENQIKGYQNEANNLNNLIKELQKQEGKYGAEASSAHANFYQTIEELRIKNSIIDELQKKNIDLENKLKHQQNLYEAVRSDRNLYSKNLREAQEEADTLTRKFMVMSHQINQLREEIKRKDEMIMKEGKASEVVQKNKKATETKVQVIEEKKASINMSIKHREETTAKLKYVISEAMAEKQKQMKDYEMVLNERDILGAQLIKRNQELDSLYEKIKISQSNLAKGEKHFRDKQQELAELKKRLIEARQELEDSQSRVVNIGQFKSEINSLEKEILKEKTKNRALQDEQENPMNVHRWKKMEATDPDNYERIMKIQTLQRRVITKTEEVEEKDKLIKKIEAQFLELKKKLSKQPGPEIFSQLEIYEASYKERTSQLKDMLRELKEVQAKSKAYKFEISMLNDQIAKMKQDYYKRREQEEKAKMRALEANTVSPSKQNREAYLRSLGIAQDPQPDAGLGIGGSALRNP